MILLSEFYEPLPKGSGFFIYAGVNEKTKAEPLGNSLGRNRYA